MAVPKRKDELLAAIEAHYGKLRSDLTDIPGDLARMVELPGHKKETKMSISNLVGYLIGWGELVLKWHRKRDNHEEVDFPETGYKWTELGSLAQKFYKDYENDDFATLLRKLDSTKEEIVLLIKGKQNEELYGSPWYRKTTMGHMIHLNTAAPYKNARARVRKWKKERSLL